jgi:hypothetical protein
LDTYAGRVACGVPASPGDRARRLTTPQQHPSGVIGFDGDRRARRSGPRTHGHLANAPCKPIGADNKRTDFALAA